jgi:hypothetical protein
MPTFTPPTVRQAWSSDPLFGRYRIPVGQSVVKVNGVFKVTISPWLGEIADLEEGVDWFQGGRTYFVTASVAAALTAASLTVDSTTAAYGRGLYGSNNYGG